jgi:mRNA-degrading endonuclease RelE of RelBE toxin-antitoxin system
MSAREIVKQVKALPLREREKVLKAILALEENEPPRQPVKTKHVKWPDVEARAKRIFGKRVLPNLVLLERDEEAF